MAFNDATKVHRFHNTAAGIRRLVSLLLARPGVRVVVEATGGSEKAVLEACRGGALDRAVGVRAGSLPQALR